MKTVLLSLLLLLSSQLFAQKGTDKYIVVYGGVSHSGSIRITTYANPGTGVPYQKDTLIKKTAFDAILKVSNSPLYVLNELAKDGWVLVTAVLAPTNYTGDAGEMLYYMRKTF